MRMSTESNKSNDIASQRIHKSREPEPPVSWDLAELLPSKDI